MPLHYCWYDTDRVLVAVMTGRMDGELIPIANQMFIDGLDLSRAERVYTIADVSGITDIASISHFRKVDFSKHRRCAQVAATVGASGWVRVMLGLATSIMFRNKLFFTNTLPEAIDALRRHVPELADLPDRDIESLTPFLVNETVG